MNIIGCSLPGDVEEFISCGSLCGTAPADWSHGGKGGLEPEDNICWSGPGHLNSQRE